MPYHFEFDSEHKILVLVVEGVADDAEIMTVNQVIAAQVDRLQSPAGISAHRSKLRVVRSMPEALAALGVTDLPKFEPLDST